MDDPTSPRSTAWPRRVGIWTANRWADDTVFAGVVTALFLAVGALGVLHHEMWRDEMHAWLLARDSSSLWNVFAVTRYEAHFALWRVLLYGLSRWTHNPVAMQWLSLLVAAGTVWIVARFAPFRRLERLLFSFGYFTLFEYCLVAQDYNLIVVLVFSFCALYGRRAGSYLGLSIVLALMANTVPYGFAMAVAFASLLVFDWFLDKEGRRNQTVSRGNLWASGLILLGGFASAGLQLILMKESPSTTWKPALSFTSFADAIANLWCAYVPVPFGFPYCARLWLGTNFVLKCFSHGREIAVVLAMGCLVISIGLLARRPSALFLYAVGVGTLLWIQFAVSIGALRHTGFLFMLFLAALWIRDASGGRELSAGRMRRLGDWFGRWRRPFVIGLLVIHLAAGSDMFCADWLYPFSGSKAAAQYIRDQGLSDLVVVGSEETRIAPLSGYLGKPIYYPDTSRFGSYIDYSKPVSKISVDQVIKDSWELVRQTRAGVVLVVSRPILVIGDDESRVPLKKARIRADGALTPLSEAIFPPSGSIKNLAHYRGAVDEDYYMYLILPD